MNTSSKERDARTVAIQFLRGDDLPSVLTAEKRIDDLKAVLKMIRDDAPRSLEMTDPALYTRLRDRITDLRRRGWGYIADHLKLEEQP